jgi:hypothetical protein
VTAAKPAARDQGGLPARWPGVCCLCKQAFDKGTAIAKMRGLPCHVRCYQLEHE